MLHENKEEIEYVILVAVDHVTEKNDYTVFDVDASLDELSELADTAGAVVVGRVVQKLPHFNPSTYIGSGKIEELKTMIYATGATGIIADDELSPSQMYNLSQALDIKIMDRTMLILDIFAAHARSAEGKLQIELAQLEYNLSRLTGKGTSMSRLGGGIGTRGPGEKKLEQDRRVIRKRVSQLKHDIKEMAAHREITRAGREKGRIPVFAIVGYTNVGKSTLLNALTGADILAEDKLFATLDTTTRVFEYKRETGKQKILLTDTVGFIRKLPHDLIDAFRSTLEEAKYADYIIHVVDASSPDRLAEMKVVYNTLDELGITGKRIVTIFNKIDKIYDDDMKMGLFDPRAVDYIRISARNRTGLSLIPEMIDKLLREDRTLIEHIYSYDEMGKVSEIKKNGEVIEEEYLENGIYIKAYV